MKNKFILWLIGIALVFVGWLIGFVPQSPLGGVTPGQAYIATTTSSTSGSGTYSYPLCVGHATLGSLTVVQPATTGYVELWHATSTATSTYASTNIATTNTFGISIAKVLSASDVVGTLNFDKELIKGLVIETASDFNGQYVVSCRK